MGQTRVRHLTLPWLRHRLTQPPFSARSKASVQLHCVVRQLGVRVPAQRILKEAVECYLRIAYEFGKLSPNELSLLCVAHFAQCREVAAWTCVLSLGASRCPVVQSQRPRSHGSSLSPQILAGVGARGRGKGNSGMRRGSGHPCGQLPQAHSGNRGAGWGRGGLRSQLCGLCIV